MRSFQFIFLFPLILILGEVRAQGGGGGDGTQSPVALEKILPPPPEAGAIGKYGAYPVGLFTGTPNLGIELYRLKSKKLEVPITLRYSANGVKVDEMPTKTGMSWTLIAGGAITRTIYDKPDDTYGRAPKPPSTDISSRTSTDLSIPTWVEGIDVNHSDTQFDEYDFSFNGYSGKFYIDLDNNPVLVPYSNLKIELNPFKITTPEGLQYYFGENGATESTIASSGSCARDDLRGAKSAWYLTRIVDPNDPSNNVSFTYVQSGYTYTANFNETITFWDASNMCTGTSGTGTNPDPCGCGPTPCIYGGPGSPNLSVDNFCQNRQIISIPYISEITSSLFGKIKFNYTLGPFTPALTIDRLLSSLTVYQNNDATNLLKSFNLIYTLTSPSTTGQITSIDNMPTIPTDMSARPFLTKMQELDNSGTVIKTHTFEYNDISHMTARLSSSQDAWGYYNGKANGNSFIPADGTNTLLIRAKVADRTTDYDYASKGILTKVNFPTGGNVQFVYEGNALTQAPPPPPPPTYVFIPNAVATNTSTATFYVLSPVTVSVSRSIVCCTGGVNTCAAASGALVYARLNGNSGPVVSYTFAEYNTRGECSFSRADNITLQPGVYGIETVPFDSYQLSVTVTAINGNIYTLGPNLPNTSTFSTYGAGMRVKQQITYDPVSGQSLTTSYQYDGIRIPYAPRYTSPISWQETPWLSSDDGYQTLCNSPQVCLQGNSCKYIQLSSNSSINTMGRGGLPVYYRNVTESLGNDFAAGGTEHTYNSIPDADLNLLRGAPIQSATAPSYSWKNGEELQQNVFKIVGPNKVYLKKTGFDYIDDPRINKLDTQYAIIRAGHALAESTQYIGFCTDGQSFNLQMDIFNIMSFVSTQQWTYLSQKNDTVYDQNGTNPMITATKYYYDNPVHTMVTRTVVQDSRGYTLVTRDKYPADSLFITNLNATESDAIHKLLLQNNQQPLLEKEDSVNGVLTKRFHTGFKDWGGGVLNPQVVKTQAGSQPIESRVSFQQYDADGNLLVQSKVNDVNTAYIWDYKAEYPVAEAKNADNVSIAYTSFEADGNGGFDAFSPSRNTTISLTGHKSYDMTSGSISKSGLTIGKSYVIDYWSTAGSLAVTGGSGTLTMGKTVNGWTCYEQEVTASGATISLSGSGSIDEIRICPADAQMTTYTYDPLIGMTSSSDPANHIAYYFYDGLGRLQYVKDQDGNIIKTFEYHYMGQ